MLVATAIGILLKQLINCILEVTATNEMHKRITFTNKTQLGQKRRFSTFQEILCCTTNISNYC
ncbi:hypothetical protein O6H91_17G006400 [Diphasiastrum complanatum]|uniref:Uncharacterized protein n=1 Tax=Diphasiastrum complanatum TaxID=34168 RepID=A0ACC2B3V9_DIPCM|nr:hypothetical protein O6H91_17G006400 [Diphasiastrum complanatum]